MASLFATIGTVCVAVLSIGAASAQEATKIRFGNISGIAFPTFTIAQEKGFFAKEKLDVSVVNVGGSGAIAEALASNNIDLGNANPTTGFVAIAKGAKFKLISGFEYTFVDKTGRSWESTFVAVRQNEGIKTLKDLRGKKIAVNDIGSAYTYMLMDQFKRMGFDTKKDLQLVPMPFSQMAGALLQKQVDAAVAISDAVYQMRQRTPVDLIATHTSLEGSDISLTSTVGVTNDFASKNPDAVVRFMKAMLGARQWMDKAIAEQNPELLETITRVMKFTPERATMFWESRGGYYGKDAPFINVLDIPQRLVTRQIDILTTAELMPSGKTFVYNDFVDISFLQKAYEGVGMKWDNSKH